MKTFRVALRRAFIATSCFSLMVSMGAAQDSARVSFTFSTFTVPGATSLAVESINDAGTISGYYGDAAGDTVSYLRASNGTVTTYQDPLNTSLPSFTEGGQINKSGIVVGEFFNTASALYEGFVYKSSAGTFSSYQVPGQPAATTTSLTGVNNNGNLCGYVIPPPYSLVSAFIEVGGSVNIFSVNGSANSACEALNDAGTAVGYYTDSNAVYHGWMRTSSGTITTFDVPGASTVTGTAPCISTLVAGTAPLGINNAGYVSGHYWDTLNNEHGFIMTPAGKFITINVPGAYQTSGGGINSRVVLVGHYSDSACNSSGYIAKPS